MRYWFYKGNVETRDGDDLGEFMGVATGKSKNFPLVNIIRSYLAEDQFIDMTFVLEVDKEDFKFMQSLTENYTH